jgi:hypothetical protein
VQGEEGWERRRTLPAFTPLPLGSVRPRGWLLAQLRVQADGLTGLLERVWPDVGPSSGWLGGSGESWERGPYYCDGLVPLAWLLGDEALQRRARRWVEWTLASQRPDGSFGPAANADWWPRVVMLGVLEQYHSATGDERVPPFVERFLRHLDEHLADRPFDMWAVARAGEYLAPILATYARTGEEWLLDLADRVLAAGTDWPALYRDWPFPVPAARLGWGRVLRRYLPWHVRVGGWTRRLRPAGGTRDRSAASVRRANALPPLVFYHATHGVNHAMALRVPAYRAALRGQAGPLADADLALSRLAHDHGSVLGLPVADEHLAGRSPVHGIELCAVVETMRSLQVLVSVSGEGRWADLLERVALNALPATLAPDVRSHQYYQQVTQVEVTRRRRPWFNAGKDGTLFGLEPTYGCCAANLHQGWPRLAAAAVQRSADGGLALTTLLPCTAETEVGGLRFGVEVSTDYPFGGEVSVTVAAPDGPVDAPLRVRMPDWAEGAELGVAGRRIPDPVLLDGFAVLARRWHDGDTVHLRLPMPVRAERAPLGDTPRPADGVVLLRGPLVLALALTETWTVLPGPGQLPDWEVRTHDRWNVALCAQAVAEPGRLQVVDRGVDEIPYSHERPAMEIVVPAREVPGWRLHQGSAGPVPDLATAPLGPVRPVRLVPYGSTALRVGVFPTVTCPPGAG